MRDERKFTEKVCFMVTHDTISLAFQTWFKPMQKNRKYSYRPVYKREFINDTQIHVLLPSIQSSHPTPVCSARLYPYLCSSTLAWLVEQLMLLIQNAGSHTSPSLSRACVCVFVCSVIKSLWPVWGILTPPILVTLFMGVVVVIAMFG